jgi:hypothetical protein
MDTATSTKRPSKLPSIWWHKGERQFASKIGWKKVLRNDHSILVRDFQRLGKDEREAMRRAMAYQEDWLWTVNFFKTSRKTEKPYWLPSEIMRLYRTVVASPGNLEAVYAEPAMRSLHCGEESGEEDYQSNDEQLREGRSRRLTLAEAKDLFLAKLKERIGLAEGKRASARRKTYPVA